MKLKTIAEHIAGTLYGSGDTEITGITYDSRTVKPGFLFVALPGHHVDGKTFIPAALKAGAAAVLTDECLSAGVTASVLVVADVRAALAQASAVFYHYPDRQLRLIGVTGTNGKTTSTYLLESILSTAGLPCGIMGTVNYRYGTTVVPAVNTTPQSADVYAFFHELVKEKRQVAVMEVSSHALALGRVHGMEFDTAVFTNLTRDHLDFHGTMEKYFDAKASLFSCLGPGQKKWPKFAIINADDPYGSQLSAMSSGATVVMYGIKKKAAVRAESVRISARCTEFSLVSPKGTKKVRLMHLGLHNVYNALAAAATALNMGISLDDVVQGLEQAPPVPGRLERVPECHEFSVLVDFAHTDDALRNVLTLLRETKPVRIITVFGCGGDRDRSKRPLMGDTVSELSDFAFVTSDNPRSEKPEKIALDIEVGIRRKHRNNYQVILDREQAIAAAIAMARKGDIILLAGKGHETYQIIGNQKIHFNDTETAVKYLRQRAYNDARQETSAVLQKEFKF